MKKISDITPFFKKDKSRWIFTGKLLEIWIPSIYQERGLLTLGEDARCLGIFQLRFNNQMFANFLFLGFLQIDYSSERNETEDGNSYIVLTINQDQTFIKELNVVKNSSVIYDVFTTMITLGHFPAFLEYNVVHQLFDNAGLLTGLNLGVNHSIWEMIYSHLFRDKKDPYKHYRLTNMKEAPVVVSFNQISHGPESTTAKLLGSYMNEGIVSALVDGDYNQPSPVENLLRS